MFSAEAYKIWVQVTLARDWPCPHLPHWKTDQYYYKLLLKYLLMSNERSFVDVRVNSGQKIKILRN